jgi:hypothetical protein
MPTITGLTAARMLEIEGESVVDGEIIGGNLILTRHDGSTINAGPVLGPVGPQGPQGPAGASVVSAIREIKLGLVHLQIRRIMDIGFGLMERFMLSQIIHWRQEILQLNGVLLVVLAILVELISVCLFMWFRPLF